ncbi:MAG: hypothetical protein QNI84_15845 [Henriciella sp.]|nr:hypothetical protein [Henriciella sp.]
MKTGTISSFQYRLCAIVALGLFCFFSGPAMGQANFNVKKTEDPDAYVTTLLAGIEAEGMSTIRAEFESMGLNTPQNEVAIAVYESIQKETDERWTDLISVISSGDVLRQYYAYAYLGGNGWIFIRVDFVRTSDQEWALSNLMFNSEYASVVARTIPTDD